MGRYVSGDFEYKFWFATQPSIDIELFGGHGYETHNWVWDKEDLPTIQSTLKKFEKIFKKRFRISVHVFFKKMGKKGYTTSSNDKETNTKKWKEMCRLASIISLGRIILESVKEKDNVDVCFEV